MQKQYNKSSGAFFYTLFYVVALISILLWHPLINVIFTGALICIPTACFLSTLQRTTPYIRPTKACLTLWGFQSLGIIIALILYALWFTQLPTYHTHSVPNFSARPSLSLIFSSFVLAAFLIMLSILMKQKQQSASILVFFPNQKKMPALANWGNFWFLRATFLSSLLLVLLSCRILLSCFAIKVDVVAFILSTMLIGLALRLPSVYLLLQIMIKRFKIRLLSFLLCFFAAIIPLSFFIHWLILGFGTFAVFDLHTIGQNASLVAFWGVALIVIIPVIFSIAPQITDLSPVTIFSLCLTNPFLWLIFFWDYQDHLFERLTHLSIAHARIISVIALVFSLLWLRSKRLAQLSGLFFGHLGQFSQGSMPRNLVLSYFSFLFFLLAALFLNAGFILQVELLVTGTGVVFSCMIAFYLFLFRVPYES